MRLQRPLASFHAAHDAGTDRATAFAHGEAHTGFECHGATEFEGDVGTVARLEDASSCSVPHEFVRMLGSN